MDGAGGVHGGTAALPFTGEAIPMRRDIDMLKGGQPKTLNEMETELHSLHKENFDLKMTIYYQKDKIERLNGGEMDSGERERDLEEHIADLEYRMQEKDARLDELEAFLAHHHHTAQQQQFQQQHQQQASRDLKDEMRQVSADAAAAAEAQEALVRGKAVFEERLTDMQALLGRIQNEKQAAEENLAHARVEAAEWQQKVRVVEEAKGMLQREMEARLHEARRALEDAQQRHTIELSRAQQEATEASNAATAAASQLVAVSSRYQQQQQQQQQQQSSSSSSSSSSSWAAVEEHRLRAEEAERRVRELEGKLGHYQAELRELSRTKARMGTGGEDREAAAAAAAAAAATAASASATAAVWKESLEAARRELQRERAEKEGALRALEEGREALEREKKEMRVGERGAWTELNLLKDQLANEKRAKDALLLDMADIRRHGKQQLRELLSELKEFDSVVEGNFAELFETAACAADAQQVGQRHFSFSQLV
jgi:chromosome segregation ATPase